MVNIFHAGSAGRVRKFSDKSGARYPFVYLLDDAEGKRLLSESGLRELPLYELTDGERIAMEREYIESIARLGKRYASITWWANALSEKNEHLSPHYSDLCRFYALMKTIETNPDIERIFVVCGQRLQEQLIELSKDCKIGGACLDGAFRPATKRLFVSCLGALKAAYSAFTMLARKWGVPDSFGKRIDEEIRENGPFYVIRTWLDERYLKSDDPAIEDAYFGRLPKEALDRGKKVIVVAGILCSYKGVVGNAAQCRHLLIIPEEYFLGYLDFFRALWLLFFRNVKFDESVSIKGFDVTAIYKRVFEESKLSGGSAKNLLRYLLARRLAGKARIETYIQTYENYAWEKMCIAGIREVSPGVRLLGFQHAFISRSSFKYFPGKGECEVAPFPDGIITLGEATRGLLERYGDYRPGVIKAGCALRQSNIFVAPSFNRKRHNRVLVPLTMASFESVRILRFLSASGLPSSNLDVVIRPHPAAPFEAFAKSLGLRLPDNFRLDKGRRAEDELKRADIIIYTWTTLALEGLRMGLGAVHLDILGPMYVDPLFECKSLKKTVSKPEELMAEIERFYAMGEAQYLREASEAREYLSKYFNPLNSENLEPFFQATADGKPSIDGQGYVCAGY